MGLMQILSHIPGTLIAGPILANDPFANLLACSKDKQSGRHYGQFEYVRAFRLAYHTTRVL